MDTGDLIRKQRLRKANPNNRSSKCDLTAINWETEPMSLQTLPCELSSEEELPAPWV